ICKRAFVAAAVILIIGLQRNEEIWEMVVVPELANDTDDFPDFLHSLLVRERPLASYGEGGVSAADMETVNPKITRRKKSLKQDLFACARRSLAVFAAILRCAEACGEGPIARQFVKIEIGSHHGAVR